MVSASNLFLTLQTNFLNLAPFPLVIRCEDAEERPDPWNHPTPTWYNNACREITWGSISW